MNIISLCQAANFSVFKKIFSLVNNELKINKIGIFVADAFYFKKNFNNTDFKGYDCTFLKEWDSVKAGLVRDPDYDLISSRQKMLGQPSLRSAFLADRRLFFGRYCKSIQSYKPRFTDKQMMGVLTEAIERIELFLDKVKPDIILAFVPVTLHEYLILRYAEKRGIKIRLLRSTKIENFITFHDSLFGLPKTIKQRIIENEEYNEAIKDISNKYLEKTRKEGAIYEGMHSKDYSFKHFKLMKLTLGILSAIKNEFLKLIDYDLKHDNHNPGFLIPVLLENILIPYRAFTARFYIDKLNKIKLKNITKNQEFCMYPLHFEPEIALQIYGRVLQNQIETVRIISNSLPPNMILIVKEHPRSAGLRTLRYYRKLSEIPNVIIEKAETPSINTVKKSKIVITVTGNVGLEALVLKKPVIVLGDADYSSISKSMILKCDNLYDLSKKIKDLIENHKHDESNLKNYLRANISQSVPVDLYSSLLSKEGRVNYKIDDDSELSYFKNYLLKNLTL